MPGASTVLRDRYLNYTRGTVPSAPPATRYVGLFTSATGPGTEGTEVTGGAYARVAVTVATGWSAPATDAQTGARYITNTGTITFPTATAAWGTATHWADHDAATGGTRYLFGALPYSRVINTNDVASWPAGALRVEIV